MDALITLAFFVAILGLFGVIADLVGEDSRDDFNGWPHQGNWFTPRFS
jgi:hypothetical protein